MARNEEKAQAMLNRFVSAKSAANREDKSQRPYLASECDNVPDCERYRNQIIKEISKKVSLIQNEGLDEHKVRDLNDAINKLMREKGHWERQIKSLGGPDYFRTAPTLLNAEDAEEVVPGKGYRYYGAAKKLPGVRELFSKAAPERQKRTRFEMMKGINADYFGYRDDDDGVLEGLEAAAEDERLQGLRDQWEREQAQRREDDPSGVAAEARDLEGVLRPVGSGAGEGDGAGFLAHVVVPDQGTIKQAILARRKQELLAKLAGAEAGEMPSTAGAEQRVESLESIKRLPPSW